MCRLYLTKILHSLQVEDIFSKTRSLTNALHSRPSNQFDLEDVMVFTSLAIGEWVQVLLAERGAAVTPVILTCDWLVCLLRPPLNTSLSTKGRKRHRIVCSSALLPPASIVHDLTLSAVTTATAVRTSDTNYSENMARTTEKNLCSRTKSVKNVINQTIQLISFFLIFITLQRLKRLVAFQIV